MSLQEYKEKILSCSNEKSETILQGISDSYEDDLLGYDDFPRDYFDFVLDLLSDEKFYLKDGVWNFLLVLSTESHKLTSDHYKKISEIIISNYENYINEDLCLSVCDFIARNYSFSEASEIFEQLDDIENCKPEDLKGFVNDGRRIMILEEKRRRNEKMQ